VPQTKPTPKPINRPNQTEQSRLIEASTFGAMSWDLSSVFASAIARRLRKQLDYWKAEIGFRKETIFSHSKNVAELNRIIFWRALPHFH
jgi:hypothetical protein